MITENKLLLELLRNVMEWATPMIPDSNSFQSSPPLSKKLSPKQQYEYNSFYWCRRLDSSFQNLGGIIKMTGRSLYKRKKEEEASLLLDWLVYNYEHYTVVYQGISDIASLLVNEILVLGIPYRKCSFETVCENTRIHGNNIHSILKGLQKLTEKTRDGKNMWLHRGETIKLPVDTWVMDSINLHVTALKCGINLDVKTKEALKRVLSIDTKKDLIEIMEKECHDIERQVEKLLDELTPVYQKTRSSY